MTELRLPGIERFCRTLQESCGLSYTPAKAYLFETRLAQFVTRRGIQDYESLTAVFLADAHARVAIVEALVTSETYFFREEAIFQLLPELLAGLGASPARPAVVWSLGCATGQELYSALFALELDGRVPYQAVRLYGADISSGALARAAAATYTEFEIWRGLDRLHLARFFEPVAGGGWQVARPWRDEPTWLHLNLLDGLESLPRPDLVFCRNVLIYFEDGLKRRVMAGIAERLVVGGLVVLGGSESKLPYSDLLEPLEKAPSVLRKRAN